MKNKLLSARKVAVLFLLMAALSATMFIIPASADTILAEWDYPNLLGITSVDLQDDTFRLEDEGYGNRDDGYDPTFGIKMGVGPYLPKLWASVNGGTLRRMVWRDVGGIFPTIRGTNNNPWSVDSQMTTDPGRNASLPGLTAPYYNIRLNTQGYKNLKIHVTLSGTNNAPRDFVIQYSTNNTTFNNVMFGGVQPYRFSLAQNNTPTTLTPTDGLALPSDCENKDRIFIRVKGNSRATVKGINDLDGNVDGGLALVNITVTGINNDGQKKLLSPIVDTTNTELYHDSVVTLTSYEIAKGVVHKYLLYPTGSADKGNENIYDSENPIVPFENYNENVTLELWTECTDWTASDRTVVDYTYKADNIASFSYDGTAQPINEKINSSSGRYAAVSKLIASVDGVNKFIPFLDGTVNRGQALRIFPQDNLTWEEGGYWMFETSTAGFENIKLSMDAYSTRLAPKSASLYYSVDGGINYTSLVSDKPFAITALAEYYKDMVLPAELNNKEKVFFKLVFEENLRADHANLVPGDLLTENEKKPFGNGRGNNQINNIIIAGTQIDTALFMPVSSKLSSKFELGEKIEYTTDSGSPMVYDILKNGNKIIDEAEYSNGIVLSDVDGFMPSEPAVYTVNIKAASGSNESIENSRSFTYAGGVVAAFVVPHPPSGTPSSIVDTDVFEATTGSGRLTMFPDGANQIKYDYNRRSIYIRGSWFDTVWGFDTTRSNPDGDGYWLIKTNTKGYTGLSITLDQISTTRGPADWCLAYSLDGEAFTEIDNSKTKMSGSLFTSYLGFELPPEMSDKDDVWLKIKIDGGMTLNQDTFTTTTVSDDDDDIIGRGNTGLNNIFIHGIESDYVATLEITPNDTVLSKASTYTVEVNHEDKATATVIVAQYDSSMVLIGIEIFDNLSVTEASFQLLADAANVKIMLIDGFDAIAPLCNYSITKAVAN